MIENNDVDGLSTFRGLMNGCLLGAIFWVLVIGLLILYF